MDVRKFPEQEERVESGPIQFGNDWPGLFLRGDDCMGYITTIQLHMQAPTNYTRKMMESLLKQLSSSLVNYMQEDEPETVGEAIDRLAEELQTEYDKLSPELKAPALTMLAVELEPAAAEIREEYAKHPADWWAPHHLLWGMSVRNLLRDKGFGESYFGVSNLDDIYVALVEEALKLK
jgi:hypothetical protein